MVGMEGKGRRNVPLCTAKLGEGWMVVGFVICSRIGMVEVEEEDSSNVIPNASTPPHVSTSNRIFWFVRSFRAAS